MINSDFLFISVICFTVTFLLTFLIIKTQTKHEEFTLDKINSIQNIHQKPTIRVGGIGIFISLLIISFIIKDDTVIKLIISSIPVFFAGLIEDITKKVSPLLRLIFSLISAILVVMMLNFTIDHVDIVVIDHLLSIKFVSVFLTILAISTFTNGMNIIDGLNGLALGTSFLIALTIFIISFNHFYSPINYISIAIVGTVFGIWFYNFPNGKIFIGDGGAYLLGFILSYLVIMWPEKNEFVSPFASLLLILYPFYELVRSFVRRAFTKGKSVSQPDNYHFHSLVFDFVNTSKKININKNALSTLFVLILPIYCSVWVCLYFDNQIMLILGCVLFVIIYEIIFLLIKYLKKKNYSFL